MIRTGTVEEALAAIRAGRPVLVADDADRENEADAIIAATGVSAEWIGWIIRHSSGYLCAPMTGQRADALNLPLMVPNSQDPRRTAYTVTVDAAHGVSTGISAADRAATLRILADPASGPDDLIRPGHVLPLRAVPGGVIHRGGHTEAAVDLCRLAGLPQVGALAELVRDDGSMMRLPEAAAVARRHDLVLLTIADLIAWRRAHGDVPSAGGGAGEGSETALGARVVQTGQAVLPTEHGEFALHGYRDLRTGDEHVALVATSRPGSLVRVHSECLTGDAFRSRRCDCGAQLAAAMRAAQERGGAVIYLTGHEGRGIGLKAKIDAYALQDRGRDTVQANLELGWPVDRREYGAAAAMVRDLGLEPITLLTNNPAKVEGLKALGVEVAAVERLEVGRNQHNASYLATKAARLGHALTTGQPAGGQSAGGGVA
ncbi:MAG: 3,4-dihydroxy-2-butanone-4-phosphate synthase [Bifidobacteriaceae bacterium]|nr:3,4-dihydroxy-2-butanone-4-phosphate synthase [Bifidobacteriaceae bacterium]